MNIVEAAQSQVFMRRTSWPEGIFVVGASLDTEMIASRVTNGRNGGLMLSFIRPLYSSETRNYSPTYEDLMAEDWGVSNRNY